MKHINTLRYTGSNHVTLVADKKNNPVLSSPLQATSLSSEEAEAQLKSDLSLQVEGDFDLIITEFDPKRFSKATTEQLLKAYDKTETMLGAHEIIGTILTKRGALSIIEPEDTPENENESAEPVEGAGEDEVKPERTYKKCMTEECLQARLAEARKNYKKFCTFICTKTKTEEYGIIRSARLDKRSGFIQYRIEILSKPTEDSTIYTERSGKIYGKGDDSKDLTIFDTKPEEIQLTEPAPKASKKEEEITVEVIDPKTITYSIDKIETKKTSKKASKKSTKKSSK